MFSSPEVLAGYTHVLTGSTAGATVEPGEPAHAGSASSASVWLQWTSPANGQVTVDTRGSAFDTVLAVYQGTSLPSLVLVVENDDEFGLSTSRLSFKAQAGRSYLLAVGGYEGQSGAVSFSLSLAAPPEILVQPKSQVVLENSGADTLLSVVAVGTPPLAYTWKRGDTNLPGAAGDTLTLTNASAADEGMYRVLVANAFGSATSDVAALTVAPSSDHDAFARRLPLTGEQVSASGENFTATLEAGEPMHAGVTNGASVWWTWTAPRSGLVTVDTFGSTQYGDQVMDTVLAIYTGSSVEALAPVAANDDDSSSGLRTSRVTFRAAAGASYEIAVASYIAPEPFGAQKGDILLHLSLAPDNDQFLNRLAFPPGVARVWDDNRGASLEAGERVHAGMVGGHSVWWSWVAPADGRYAIDTSGSTFDTVAAVYTGATLNALALVEEAHGDPIDNFRAARLQFVAIAGTEYSIVVDGAQGETGDVVLNIAPATATHNDAFANRSQLNGLSDVTVASNNGASLEAGEPDHAGLEGGASLWWSWQAPASGLCSIDTEGSNFDTLLAVYTGDSIGGLNLVAENDGEAEDNFLISRLEFDAVAGRTYQIAVDGYLGETGDVVLNLALEPDPLPGSNDAFANRILIAGDEDSVTGDNSTATKEPGEPNHNGNRGGRSLWWRWVAPETAVTTIDTRGSDFDTVLAVYTGTAVSALTRVVSDDQGAGEDSIVTFMAFSGTEYQIAVDSFRDGQSIEHGVAVLHLRRYPAERLIPNDDLGHATTVDPRNGVILGGNLGATREPGEPAHLGLLEGHSAWWSWTPQSSGPVTISTAGSELDTVLSVYTGSALADLTLVAENDDPGVGDFHARVSFLALAGTAYRIAVDGYAGAMGVIRLNVATQPNPPVAPTILVHPSGQTRFADNAGGGSVATFRVVASGTPPLRYQWQHNGVDIAGAVGPSLTLTNLSAADGGAYRVIVTNALGSAVGGVASLTWLALGFNDNFADRIQLQGAHASATGSILGATKESGEPAHAGNDGGRSVWWSWTAPSNGPVEIDTRGSTFDTSLAVYTNATMPSLVVVAENDDLESGEQSASRVLFEAVEGVEYQIAVDSFKTNSVNGQVELRINQPPSRLRLLADLPAELSLPNTGTLALRPELEGVTPDVRYQWTFNGAPLPQQTSDTLSLGSLSRIQAGLYALVITSDSLSITTRQTSVWVQMPQQIRSVEPLPDGRMRILFSDADGTVSSAPARFEVQHTRELAGPATVWERSVGTITPQPGALVFEEQSGGGDPQRFYRVLER
jgi:hypothetical protein